MEHAIAPSFFPSLLKWGTEQDWKWNDVEVRFTWWPVCEAIRPFSINAENKIEIAGRNANNEAKHSGGLACLRDTLSSCAAAWFIVLERAREARVFLEGDEVSGLFKTFDCYNLLTSQQGSYGTMICRPMASMLAYPSTRGESEVEIAKEAHDVRLSRARQKIA